MSGRDSFRPSAREIAGAGGRKGGAGSAPAAGRKDADTALWRAVQAGARPLEAARRSHGARALGRRGGLQGEESGAVPSGDTTAGRASDAPVRGVAPRSAARMDALSERRIPLILSGFSSEGRRSGGARGGASPPAHQLPGRLRARIRKEGIPDARTLDLHGRTLAQAESELRRFLAAHYQAGRGLEEERLLLVVTGRGRNDTGAIRTNLPRWLDSPANSERVLAWQQARPRDGGAGAYYVLVRRKRLALGRGPAEAAG